MRVRYVRYSKVRYIIQIPSSYVQYFKHLVSKQKKGKERKEEGDSARLDV